MKVVRPLIVYQTRYFLLLVIFFIVSCTADEERHISYNEKEIKEVSILLNADEVSEIVHPSWIKSVSDGFLLYDAKINNVSKYDLQGQKMFSFGSQGRGPGEFLSVGDFWKFKEGFLVYDINGQKLLQYDHSGNAVQDIPLDFIDFPGMPLAIEAISMGQFVRPSGGKNGSLLSLVDLDSQSEQHIGNAVSEEKVVNQSPDERKQAILSGNVPAMDRNNILLSSNETGIFSFQLTTATLEKYSYSGELLWQQNLKVPVIDGLFEDLFEENRSRIENGEFLLQFTYAYGISANKSGVGVLLNVSEDEPVTVVWVPNDGQEHTVVTFDELQHPSPVPLRFTVSDSSDIFFSSTLDGIIYRADWPL